MHNIKTRIIIVTIICILLPATNNAYAYHSPTHEALNNKIAKCEYVGCFDLNKYLINNLCMTGGVNSLFRVGLEKETVSDWIRYAGDYEDNRPFEIWRYGIPLRASNHFHNPTVPDCQHSGLKDLDCILNSTPVWAQKKDQSWLLGDYSWPDARQYFYDALTATDTDARSGNYAECFRAIGQVMHLVEDMSVPSHLFAV